jgi:glutamate synthase domain-containing protein 1
LSQRLINTYMSEIDRLKKFSGTTTEQVIREAFKDLLKNWSKAQNLVFIPELEYATATADSEGKGRILEGPQSWHGELMPDRIKALGLDDKYVVKFAGSADAIWAELASAEKEAAASLPSTGPRTLPMRAASISSSSRPIPTVAGSPMAGMAAVARRKAG